MLFARGQVSDSFFLIFFQANIYDYRYPDIKKFIVQDLPETREGAEGYIASKGLTRRVEFETQDFFKPQQRKGKYVFVMQRGLCFFSIHPSSHFLLKSLLIVLHDWNTEKGATMIKHIRDVLNEDVCHPSSFLLPRH